MKNIGKKSGKGGRRNPLAGMMRNMGGMGGMF
jgi:hypothetical protein